MRARQLLAVAAVILLVVSAVLAVPRSRDAIADLLGIEGLRIRTEQSPSTTAVPASSTTPGSSSTSAVTATVTGGVDFDAAAVGRDLELGSEVSLAAARAALPALRELVSSYGPPDAIYRSDRPANLVSFVWRARPGLVGSTTAPTVGLLVQQYPSKADVGFILKTLGAARARELVVEGQRGFWIDGEPHSIGYVDAGNAYVEDTVRWASNALVWASDGVTYRIESSLTQGQVVSLVASLSPRR